MVGVNGVSLFYVVQGKQNPDANGALPNFIYNIISCAPLKRDYYEASCHRFNQVLMSFTTGKTSGE